jgi:hypothetical protein
MKQAIILLSVIMCMITGITAQSFRTTSLSKGGIYTNASLLQDYDSDGDLDIIVTSTKGTSEFPVGLYWLENEPTQQFPKRAIVTENIVRIEDVDIADFDGDGRMDYLVCSRSNFSRPDGELVWFQRQSDGSYVKWTIVAGKDFNRADVGDFNNDGKPDIVALGFGQYEGYVFINDGFFFTEKIVATKITQPEIVDANDLDGDGDIDIVFGGGGLTSQGEGARVMYNDGKGNFTLGFYLVTYTNDHAYIKEDIEILDINADGKIDIIGWGLLGELFVFDGAKKFEKVKIFDPPKLGGDFIIFDIDGNKLPDLVIQDWGADQLIVLYQTAPLQFNKKEIIESNWDNKGRSQMTYGDLDGDKDLDLIFPENGNVDGDLSWFENINGKLFRHLIYSELVGARIPKFADVDKDGDQDIFLTVSSSEFSGAEEDEAILYENIGNNHFINWRLSDSLDYAADIEPADIDGDGDLDVFASARDANDLVWLKNNGIRSTWTKTVIDANINQVLGITAIDLDGDKDMDVVACSNNDDKVFWYRNDGKGGFSKLVVDANVDAPLEIEASDLDRDGDIDLALVCAGTTNTIVIYLNQGNQSFTKTIAFTSELGSDIEIADWDVDGDPDILISIFNTSPIDPRRSVVALLNAGKGSFQVEEILIGSEGVRSLKVVDLDGDKDMDLLLGSNDRVLLEGWLRGSNRITDIKRVVLSENTNSNGNIYGIDVADVDNDGLNEIVFADSRNDALLMVKFDCFFGPAIKSAVTKASCGENNGAATITPSGSGKYTYKWSTGSTDQSIANLKTGVYQVSVSSFPGCITSTSVAISREPVATVNLLATSTSCDQKDGKIETSVQGGAPITSYRWNTGDTTSNLFNLAGGIYTLTLLDTNKCKIIKEVSVTAKTKPIFSLGRDTVITIGKTLILNAKGNTKLLYQWSTGQTSTSISVNSPGVYSVKVTNLDGCSVLDSIVVKLATGISNLVEIADFKVSPNPAQNSVIMFTQVANIQGAEFFIINSTGQVVQQGKSSFAGGRSEALDVSILPAGFYSLKLVKGKYQGITKLLIVH